MTNNRNYISEDVLIDVLSSLPAKSLNRFICVCRSWCKLIKSNTFILKHHHQSEEHLIVRYQEHDLDSRIFKILSNDLTTFVDQDFFHTLPPPYDAWEYSVYGHCNGIFCLSHKNQGALWNPANREIKVFPEFPREYARSDCFHYGFRFGWDQRINDYKVVVFTSEYNYKRRKRPHTNYYRVYVYSLNNDSWRRFEGNVPFYKVDNGSDLCFDGAFYWFQEHHYNGKLLSFNISDEVFQEINGPDFLEEVVSHNTTLDKYNGRLAIIHGGFFDVDESSVDIWVLISGSCWNKVLTVGPFPNIMCPHGIWKHGEIILKGQAELEDLVHEYFHIYDPRTQQLNDHVVHGNGIHLNSYKESLVSVKKMS